MLSEYVNNLATEINKQKDQWFMDILYKHGLISNPDVELSGFDLYMVANEENVKIVHMDKKTQVYINDGLVGEWNDTYEFEKENDKYVCKTTYWNK